MKTQWPFIELWKGFYCLWGAAVVWTRLLSPLNTPLTFHMFSCIIIGLSVSVYLNLDCGGVVITSLCRDIVAACLLMPDVMIILSDQLLQKHVHLFFFFNSKLNGNHFSVDTSFRQKQGEVPSTGTLFTHTHLESQVTSVSAEWCSSSHPDVVGIDVAIWSGLVLQVLQDHSALWV